jgi:hypothetical protein
MSTIKFAFYCSDCKGTGANEVWCYCNCPKCYSSVVGREYIVCPACKGKFKGWFGWRCPKCLGSGGRVTQTCSKCRGTGRDPNCPKCQGIKSHPCWCTATGLRSVKSVDLSTLLPSLPATKNSVTFYDNDDGPGSNWTAPGHMLSFAQLVDALQTEGAVLSGHNCTKECSCKVNWPQTEPRAESVGYSTTAVTLTVLGSTRDRSAREISRVGPNRYIYIGSDTYGGRSFNWDAGQRALEGKL